MEKFVVRFLHLLRVQFDSCKTSKYYPISRLGVELITYLAIFNKPQACFIYNPKNVAIATIIVIPTL